MVEAMAVVTVEVMAAVMEVMAVTEVTEVTEGLHKGMSRPRETTQGPVVRAVKP